MCLAVNQLVWARNAPAPRDTRVELAVCAKGYVRSASAFSDEFRRAWSGGDGGR